MKTKKKPMATLREELKDGIVVQLKRKKESKSFTIHNLDKPLEEVRTLMVDYIDSLE